MEERPFSDFFLKNMENDCSFILKILYNEGREKIW
ncbi:hypothetical protein SAMN04490247_1954 [Salimicrobium halophilum]|uniref:Uncharacterized protein n=1 Tax=Salimicrobium halophilum TaxID=86666 RepID=A0A1G8TVM1_9BACI|nr:hypothetical protein SAMN04490247_1954 [Salimicrobium halophilum]